MLYSNKIYQNGNQEKPENVWIQLKEHRKKDSSHISLRKPFPQGQSWIWIGKWRMQCSVSQAWYNLQIFFSN